MGALLGWLIGFYGGRSLLERRGQLLHLGAERLARADRWFARHGAMAVLVGRVTPVVRSFVSIPAGAARMPVGRYAALTLVGSAVWAFALAGVGWGVGSGYRHFHSAFDLATVAMIVAVVVVALGVVVRARRVRSAVAE